MTKKLITSALPYINGVKHLGNFAGSLLPADVHARFCRLIGQEVLFVCATDEHGTPAEIAAAEAGQSPDQFCAEQHLVQAAIYEEFNLSFDYFGRSSSDENKRLTQSLFTALDEAGCIAEGELRQIYSAEDKRFLPDRYVVGTCPNCGFPNARGDQCENCTRQLDPTDLIHPRSALSGTTDLEFRNSKHLFLRQSALVERLEEWLGSRKDWSPLVLGIARKWLSEGLRDRCITRDLSWGVPVPKPGYQDKVFYVWFDAPIEYIAAVAELGGNNLVNYWWKSDDVEYVQFMGKDNIPFHTIGFPCTIIGSGAGFKLPDNIKGFSWLNYEGGKFSTSQRRGVFLDQALKILPVDYWRWWLTANAPEASDTNFSFSLFATNVNHDLANTFGNLIRRVAKFTHDRFAGAVPPLGELTQSDQNMLNQCWASIEELKEHYERLNYRKTGDALRAIWGLANGYFADQAPWSIEDVSRRATVCAVGLNLVALCALVSFPVMPSTCGSVLDSLNVPAELRKWPGSLDALLKLVVAAEFTIPNVHFERLDQAWVARMQENFSGELTS